MSALTTITIASVEEGQSKRGAYCIVKDQEGNRYSIWDMKWYTKFEGLTGQSVDLQELGLTIKEKVVAGKRYLNIEEIDERPSGYHRSDKMAVQEDQKAARIARAMDRNEYMYAKLGATQMVAFHPAYKGLNGGEIEKMVEHLTNFILEFKPDGEHKPHGAVPEIPF